MSSEGSGRSRLRSLGLDFETAQNLRGVADFDRHFIAIARVIEATFRVVGETELADRIRPTVRGLDRASGEKDSTEAGAGAPEALESEVPESETAESEAAPESEVAFEEG